MNKSAVQERVLSMRKWIFHAYFSDKYTDRRRCAQKQSRTKSSESRAYARLSDCWQNNTACGQENRIHPFIWQFYSYAVPAAARKIFGGAALFNKPEPETAYCRSSLKLRI